MSSSSLQQQQQHKKKVDKGNQASLKYKNNNNNINQHSLSYGSQQLQQIKSQNTKLKRALKQQTAKRSSLVKECSQYQKQIQQLQQQIQTMRQHIDQQKIDKQGDHYRVQQLRFLNKQLSEEITQLRDENQSLIERVKYCSDVVQKKYQELQEKTMKRMQQSLKRTKKAIHYLQTLSIKDIQKTKEILIDNLKKSVQLLKGKYVEDNNNAEYEINQLMDPLRKLQQQLSLKSKQANSLKVQNKKLLEQVKKHKKIQCQLLPQYKSSIQGLKRNLAQVRAQLSQNQIQKVQIKKKYEQKLRTIQQKHQQLLVEYRKNKLQKKIFQNKLQQLQQQKQQEKQRLVGENQMLKKLYQIKKKANNHYQRERQNTQHLFQQEFIEGGEEEQEQQQSQLSQHQDKRRTNLKKYQRGVSNFKKRKYSPQQQQQQQSYYQNNQNEQQQQSNLYSGYNSADYYNNHKTTKNTYGDQAIQLQSRKRNINFQRKLSYKGEGNYGRRGDIIRTSENSRLRTGENVDNTKKYKQHLTVSHSRNNNNAPQNVNKNLRNYNNRKQLDRSKLTTNQKQQNDDSHQYSQQQQQEGYEFADQNDTSSYQPQQQQTSMMSQQSLKNQICRIDQEIIEIQKNLTKELQAYK